MKCFCFVCFFCQYTVYGEGPYIIDTGFKNAFVMKSARMFCVIYLPNPRTRMKSQNLAYFPDNCINILLCKNIALTEIEKHRLQASKLVVCLNLAGHSPMGLNEVRIIKTALSAHTTPRSVSRIHPPLHVDNTSNGNLRSY